VTIVGQSKVSARVREIGTLGKALARFGFQRFGSVAVAAMGFDNSPPKPPTELSPESWTFFLRRCFEDVFQVCVDPVSILMDLVLIFYFSTFLLFQEFLLFFGVSRDKSEMTFNSTYMQFDSSSIPV